MHIFKSALRVFFKHPVYILIYVVWLTFMGVFIGMSSVGSPQGDFNEERPAIAVIDRDDSELSRGLTAFLGESASLSEVDDTRQAMQDAIAQNYVSYLMIIPEGFGEDFEEAAAADKAAPQLETVASYDSIAANMMNGLVNEYLNTAQLYISSSTATDPATVVSLTGKDMENTASASMVSLGDSAPVSQQWTLYMKFSGYTIMLSIIVCVSVMMAAFNRTEVRRRDLTAPISSLSMNLQIAAACLVVALLAWAWVSVLGLAVFGQSLAGVDPKIIGLVILDLLAFCTVPLAIGFLIGQLTTSELVMNAAGNIVGLVFSFIGGIWVPLDFMGDAIRTLAYFTPTYYYGDAINRAVNLHDFSGSSLSPIFADMGITLLFAVAIFAVALVAGRIRIQSAEAGGNAAAARMPA